MDKQINVSGNQSNVSKGVYKICDHIIGVLHDYDNTRLITAKELNDEIEYNKLHKDCYKTYGYDLKRNIYDWNDYSDRRKNTDIERFSYCPLCGTKIDWKRLCNYYTLLQ